jgi:hypothetical protein
MSDPASGTRSLIVAAVLVAIAAGLLLSIFLGWQRRRRGPIGKVTRAEAPAAAPVYYPPARSSGRASASGRAPAPASASASASGESPARSRPQPRAGQKSPPPRRPPAEDDRSSFVGRLVGRGGRSVPQGVVYPLVLGQSGGVSAEPRLPADVVTAECTWGSGYFHGQCLPAQGRRFVVRAAAVRGIGHARKAAPGQDVAGAAWDDKRRSLLVAVADGLGSLPDSGPVAHFVAAQALRVPGTLLGPDDDVDVFAGQIFRDIADNARQRMAGEHLNGAATLVLAEIRPARNGALVTVCGVGDSEAWCLSDGVWRVLHHERGQREENATRQLPGYPEPRIAANVPVASGSVVLLGTDGFAGALDTIGSPLSQELAQRWRKTPSPLDFVTHVDFVEDARTDDRAVVAVWID